MSKTAFPAWGLILAALWLSGCGSSDPASVTDGGAQTRTVEADPHTLQTPALAAGEFELVTLSTLPDAVTGGDVLLALRGLAMDDRFRVRRNGEDISAVFGRDDSGDLRGLVTGLGDSGAGQGRDRGGGEKGAACGGHDSPGTEGVEATSTPAV